MADDEDEVGEEAPFDPTFATAGPRRSTFTPPPASGQRPAGEDGTTDDDALADALAAEYTLLGSGTISLPPERPAAEVPSVLAPPAQFDPEPASKPLAPEPPGRTAPWSSAPAPDPAQAVPLESPFEPPVRRSLPDDELLRWVEEAGKQPGGTLDVIEQLETQLRLREEEAKEFQAWESRMHSLGPDAAAVVEDARPEFPGALPSVPVPPGFPPPAPDSFVASPESVSEWPAPVFADAEPMPRADPLPEQVVPEPVVEPPAPPPAPPAWDV
ncbi:MAG: hypothetical protein ACSLFR_15180, partial [Solirubrobacteraceae bacterium]